MKNMPDGAAISWAGLLDDFMARLSIDRGVSFSTLDEYSRDLLSFVDFANRQELADPHNVSSSDILAWLKSLRDSGLSPRTTAR
ncbi:MAG: hypothetical protein EHM49_09235, partial [Deltaproteobacteria bacterium]